MDNIITNPGLQHIAENVLWNLDIEHLQMYGLINQFCKSILDTQRKEIRTFECSCQKNLLLPKILAVQVTRPISFEAEKLFNDLSPG